MTQKRSQNRQKLNKFLIKIENLQWIVWIFMILSIFLFGYFHFYLGRDNWFWLSSIVAAILYFPNNKFIAPLIRSAIGIIWTFTVSL